MLDSVTEDVPVPPEVSTVLAAEAEMAKMENDLKGKLLEIRGGV